MSSHGGLRHGGGEQGRGEQHRLVHGGRGRCRAVPRLQRARVESVEVVLGRRRLAAESALIVRVVRVLAVPGATVIAPQ